MYRSWHPSRAQSVVKFVALLFLLMTEQLIAVAFSLQTSGMLGSSSVTLWSLWLGLSWGREGSYQRVKSGSMKLPVSASGVSAPLHDREASQVCPLSLIPLTSQSFVASYFCFQHFLFPKRLGPSVSKKNDDKITHSILLKTEELSSQEATYKM